MLVNGPSGPDSGNSAEDRARAFGLIQAPWATRKQTRNADDPSAYLAAFQEDVSRFESEYDTLVGYYDTAVQSYTHSPGIRDSRK
jgi:hypothetical protein